MNNIVSFTKLAAPSPISHLPRNMRRLSRWMRIDRNLFLLLFEVTVLWRCVPLMFGEHGTVQTGRDAVAILTSIFLLSVSGAFFLLCYFLVKPLVKAACDINRQKNVYIHFVKRVDSLEAVSL